MHLSPGARLGSYEILAPLGTGGMGEVYRARDTKLERDVAVKVLPARLADDPESLARFEREARAVAALSHPNILAIHDLGRHEGTAFAVMELLEGESLRTRLAVGALPARKAVDYGLQVAHGLAAAHEKGIVHRDLKPENVFITKEGRLKILDFGLAKQTAPAPSGSDTSSPTMGRHTEPGVVIGTAGYMSPEQVRGRSVDHRSDIFSFGVLLFEMLSGQRAFQKDSAAETMTAILKEEPADLPIDSRAIPPALDRVVRHCLEKHPEERFQSARDLGFALASLAEAPSAATLFPLGGPSWRRRLAPWLTGAGLLATLALGVWIGRTRGQTPPPSLRQLSFRRGFVSSARFAPDGRTVLYGAAWEGNPIQVFSTRTDAVESQALALPNADVLSISPSGEMALSLGRSFFSAHMSRGTLARAPLAGGAPREMLEGVQEADWSPDGSGVLVVRSQGGRYRLESPPGSVIHETTGWISHARFSPRGDRIAFIDHPLYGDDHGFVTVAGRVGAKRVISGDWGSAQGLAWSPRGGEVWFTAGEGSGRSLRAATLAGRERLILQVPGVLTLHDISPTGAALLAHGSARAGIRCLAPGAATERDLSWFDYSYAPSLSSDGRMLLFSEAGVAGGPQYGVYLRKTDGSPAARLGDGDAQALSPDGRWALADVYSSPQQQLLLLPTGAGEVRRLTVDGMRYSAGDWFPDGKKVLFEGQEEGRGVRLYVHDLEVGKPKAITPEGFRMRRFSNPVSPDGKQVVAVASDQTSHLFSIEGGGPRLVAGVLAEDELIRWGSDGGSLYVFRPGQMPTQVVRVDLATGRRERLREIMPSEPTGIVILNAIDMTPDGASYAYRYHRVLSDLYRVEGLR